MGGTQGHDCYCVWGAEEVRLIQQQEEVLYLTRDPHPACGFANVYCLRVQDESRIELSEEYFTLSPHGITRFAGGTIDFAELAQWVDEKRAFDHMTSMSGLVRVQQMLFFFSWKKKTVMEKHRRVRSVNYYSSTRRVFIFFIVYLFFFFFFLQALFGLQSLSIRSFHRERATPDPGAIAAGTDWPRLLRAVGYQIADVVRRV